MKKQLILCVATAFLAALCALPALSQSTGSVKGVALDDQGKPIVGAMVEMHNTDSGVNYHLKTDKSGKYASIGIAFGHYNIQLMQAGNQLAFFNNVTVPPNSETVVDFKLADIRKGGPAGPGGEQQKLTEEQKKQLEERRKAEEAVTQENVTIKNLNSMLAQAQANKDAGQIDQAVATMRQASQVDATRDLIWAKLAEFELIKAKAQGTDAATRTTMATDAAEAYKKAIQICVEKPTSNSCKEVASYHNNMGQAFAMTGKTQDALAEYATAAQLNPAAAAQYYYNAGAVLTNSGKVDEANAAFQKAIDADPNKAEAWYQKGVNLLGKATVDPKTGKTVYPEEARKDIEKYLELQPQGPLANDAKAMLVALGETIQTTYGTQKKKK